MGAKSIFKGILRFIRRVIDEINELVDDITEDEVAQRALEADLGLPPGALDNAKANRPQDPGIDQYISSVSPSAEQFKVAVDFIKNYVGFWKGVFQAAQTEDPTIVVDEMVYHFFQIVSVNLVKYRYPKAYYWLRLIGVFTQDLRLSLEEAFAPEAPANFFSGDYWDIDNLKKLFRAGYLRFRLDQAADLFLEDRGPDDPPLTPDELVRMQQLGYSIFGKSDLIFLAGTFIGVDWLLKLALEDTGLEVSQFYGWELPPGADVPLSERIASRAHTLKLTSAAGAPDSSSAILTQMLVADGADRVGYLLGLRGQVVFAEKAGSEERPLKIKIAIETPDGLEMLAYFEGEDRFSFTGPPSGAMKLSIEPEQPSAVGPAISIPEVTGTRLEIGDFSFKVEINKDGFKIRAAATKSALVIVSSEGDSFVSETMKGKETRVDFELGLAADQDGIYFEGGNRLATTIPINKTVLGIKFQSVQLALDPIPTENGSELRLTAVASLGVKLGPLQLFIEQIGMTLNAGATRDEHPDDSLTLLPFFYLRELGFRPPSGIGILVDGDIVSGGGFLFYDREKEQYAGVLELEIRDPEMDTGFAIKAVGLLTTRLPDGSKGFSLLVIISVEFDPPINLFIFNLAGLGGLIGIHRTMDTDVLREGLRSHALDAVLFPKDPVANAGRLLNTLRGIFPPAKDRHLFGLAVKLGWGTPMFITAELALVFEFGESPRRVLLGQLHIVAPTEGKAILEVHMDALGIWDVNRKEFSLDARLYDSRIAFVTMSGDMALRIRKGSDPFFLLSIGGYHPEFAVPPGFPKLERLTIKFADSKHLRLILTGYFALSANTRQAGGKFDFYAGFSGFSIEGFLQIDVLWEPDVRYVADFDVKVALKYKGQTLIGAHAVGQFFGPEPKRLKGEVSIDLWLFSVNKSFDKCWGDPRPPAELPQTNPLPVLVAALQDVRSWNAQPPQGSRMLVSLRSGPTTSAQPGESHLFLHPLGSLSVRQQVLPLGIQIDVFAGGTPTGERTFNITGASLGGQQVTNPPPVKEFFAPAQFIAMSDDEKIARPSFESMTAGVSLQPQGLAYGGQAAGTENQAAVSEMDFEEVIIDANGQTVPERRTGTVRGDLAALASLFSAAGRSSLLSTGVSRFQAPGPEFHVRRQAYVIAGVDDLKAAGIGGQDGNRSYTEVQQVLEKHLQENPRARGKLQIVPGFQTEEIA